MYQLQLTSYYHEMLASNAYAFPSHPVRKKIKRSLHGMYTATGSHSNLNVLVSDAPLKSPACDNVYHYLELVEQAHVPHHGIVIGN